MRSVLIQLVCLVFSSHLNAKNNDVKSIEISAVSSTISGNFRPFSIAINGQKLFSRPDAIISLFVNEDAKKPHKNKRGSFFFKTDANEIRIAYSVKESDPPEVISIQLPTIHTIDRQGDELRVEYTGTVDKILINGKTHSSGVDGVALLKVPAVNKTKRRSDLYLSLELKGEKGQPSRQYSLRIPPGADHGETASRNMASAPPQREMKTIALTDVRLFLVSALQKNGHASLSPGLTWMPKLFISSVPYIALDFGLRPFRGQDFRSPIWTGQGLLVLGARLSDFFIEVGAGFSHWFNRIGSKPMLQSMAGYQFRKRPIPLLDKLALGYSVFLNPGFPTHQVLLGVECAL